MRSKITFVCVPLDKFQVLHGCIVILFNWKAHDPQMHFKAKWNPCCEYQKSGNRASPVLLEEYKENLPSLPFPSSTERNVRKCNIGLLLNADCSEQKKRREAVVVFLELLMHIKCIRLNVRVNEFSLIHLGETFTLAEWREIYNTRSRAIKE